MTREERIMAYADGELDAAQRAAFEIEMQHDPALAEAVEAQTALRRRVSEAYAPILAESVPAALLAAARRSPPGVGRRRLGPPVWAALAAGLAIGVFAGRFALLSGPLGPGPNGTLAARGALARALDDQLSGRVGPIEISLSFRSRDGRLCRVFHSAADRLDGLACREKGRWAAQALARSDAPLEAGDYRMAAAGVSPEVLAAADRMMAGEALDRRQEAAARDAGWR
jgi:hypothetical protein